jgi:hypothetical protein
MRGSSEIQVSPVSLSFFGLPLLRGIYFWGYRASNILPSCASPSTPGSMRCDVLVPASKGKIPFVSLEMLVESENESQLFWRRDLAIIPLRVPLLMFWEVAMVRPVFIFRAVDPANALDG